MAIHPIFLVEERTQEPAEAQLHDEASDSWAGEWEKEWAPELERAKAELITKKIPQVKWPQDLHWNWRKKMSFSKGLLGVENFAVICQNRLQGLMMVDLTKNARLSGQIGKPLVYIDFLQAAPWNRKDLFGSRQFAGVGTALILAAIVRSGHEGFQERFGLHSLPQSESYYRTKFEMSDLGPDAHKQQLRYFEASPERARRIREELMKQ
jgi:hypothetical protein